MCQLQQLDYLASRGYKSCFCSDYSGDVQRTVDFLKSRHSQGRRRLNKFDHFLLNVELHRRDASPPYRLLVQVLIDLREKGHIQELRRDSIKVSTSHLESDVKGR